MSGTLAVGVDVGGTHVKVVLVRVDGDPATDGAVIAERRIDSGSRATGAALAPAIVAAIEAMTAEAGRTPSDLVAVGLAVPGFVDPDRGRSLFSPNTPGLVGDELPRRLADALGRPVTFDSDVNSATWGEAAWGAGRGVPRFLAITLGTGVGGGLVVDGLLVRIAGGTIGDIGHLILEPGGRRCSAGCAGCAEALVGAEGIVEIAREAGAPPAVDRADLVIRAVAAGDAWAVRVAERAGRLVGILIASLMPVLLPDRVAIVGGTTVMGEPFFDAVRTTVAAVGGGPYVHGRAIVEGRYATLAGAVGAAAMALRETREVPGR
jgi:glucokinase